MGVFASMLSSGASGAMTGSAFGLPGMIAGGAIGAGLGYVTGNATEKAQRELEIERERAIKKYNTNVDEMSAAKYPSSGFDVKSLYANGGIIPLSSTAGEVAGDTHNQDTDRDGNTGVQLPGGNEVENKEIIYQDAVGNTKILSARSGFADMARQRMSTPEYIMQEQEFTTKVNDLKGRIENEHDLFKQGSLKRQLETTRHPLDDIYDQQSATNANAGIPNTGVPDGEQQFAFGGIDFREGDAARLGLSVVDNVANAALTLATPKIAKPLDYKSAPMLTDIDVNPQLNQIGKSERATITDINNNTANSNVALSRIAQARLSADDAKNKVLAEEANMETQLYNQSAANNQQVANSNIDKMNQYMDRKVQRQAGIYQDISANFSNLSDDINTVINDINNRSLQEKQMMLDMLKYPDGTTESVLLTGVLDDALKADPKRIETIMSLYKDRPAAREYLEALKKRFGLSTISDMVDNTSIPMATNTDLFSNGLKGI